MAHNRRVSVQEWLETNNGVWWWPAAGASDLIEWLAVTPSGPGRVCVIPRSAPLLDGLTPVAVCRIYCALHRIPSSRAAILTHLRTLEVPDRLLEQSVRQLEPLHRTQTWLAMARLAHVNVVILVEPLAGAPLRQQRQMHRLLQEAAGSHQHIFVVTSHPEAAAAVGACQQPPVERLVR